MLPDVSVAGWLKPPTSFITEFSSGAKYAVLSGRYAVIKHVLCRLLLNLTFVANVLAEIRLTL